MGPLRYRDFRLLWVGQVLNGIGAGIYLVAAGWLIYELSNSPLMLGFNGAFMSVATIVSSFYGGALSDGLDRRRLLLASQAIATLLGTLSTTNLIQVWHIFLVLMLGHVGLLDVVGGTVRTTILQLLTTEQMHRPMENKENLYGLSRPLLWIGIFLWLLVVAAPALATYSPDSVQVGTVYVNKHVDCVMTKYAVLVSGVL